MLPERRDAEWLPTSRRRTPARLTAWRALFHASLFAPVALFALLPGERIVPLIPWLMAAILGLSTVLPTLEIADRVRRRRRVPPADLPVSVEQFPCTLVLKAGAEYGTDEGLVAFTDGWLVFDGRATAFAVRATDVRRTFERGHPAFEWDSPHGSRRAVLRPLGRRLYQPWVEWPRTFEPIEGIPVFPPARPMPGHRPSPVRLVAGLALLALALLTFAHAPITPFVEIAIGLGYLLRYRQEIVALRRLRGEPALPPGVAQERPVV